MWKRLCILLLAFSGVLKSTGQQHGLQFRSHENVPEQRTALNLNPKAPFCFTGNAEVAFEFNFRPNLETYFGYVLRIIAKEGDKSGAEQNIDIVYNQILRNFNFVVGEVSTVFELDSATLHSKWNKIRLRFDKTSGQVSLFVNDRLCCEAKLTKHQQLCLQVLFGINDNEGFQTVDLPPMQVRNISIKENGTLKHDFPLNEIRGNEAVDLVTKQHATVKNAIWIKPRHQQWQAVSGFSTAGAASVAFDEKKEILYIISKDSLFSVSVKDMSITGTRLTRTGHHLPAGNQAVVDPSDGKLLNFYIDQKQVSIYNPATNDWTADFNPGLLTEFWQANKFVSPIDSSLYILAGYGQLRYKNTMFRYHIPTGKWDSITPTGDFFMPRYLAAVGMNKAKDTAYVLGGYGSNTGDQKINPRHAYDMMTYSVRGKSFQKLIQLEEPQKHFAFANSFVIDDDSGYYYALVYPRDRFKSSLQLLRGSLRNSAYQLMADTIAYDFHDIESFSDLFFARGSRKLIAVTIFTGKDSSSSVNLYSLDFPPNQLPIVTNEPDKHFSPWIWIAGAFAIVIIAVYGFKRKSLAVKEKPSTVPAPLIPQIPEKADLQSGGDLRELVVNEIHTDVQLQPYRKIVSAREIVTSEHLVDEISLNKSIALERSWMAEARTGPSIHLFGQFQVSDQQGNDITRMFTPLLKELFLLILINSVGSRKGISSEALTEVLWHSKSEKDAKNNRSVNIAKLKSITEKLGALSISKDSGLWKCEVMDESVYIDFRSYTLLQQSNLKPGRGHIESLLDIIQRGSFLSQTDYNWLDDTKSSVSNRIIDDFTSYLETVNIPDEAEMVIEICNSIFHFDRLNEQALEYKCKSLISLKRHALANTTYLNFVREYREIYQEDFARPFNEVIR